MLHQAVEQERLARPVRPCAQQMRRACGQRGGGGCDQRCYCTHLPQQRWRGCRARAAARSGPLPPPGTARCQRSSPGAGRAQEIRALLQPLLLLSGAGPQGGGWRSSCMLTRPFMHTAGQPINCRASRFTARSLANISAGGAFPAQNHSGPRSSRPCWASSRPFCARSVRVCAEAACCGSSRPPGITLRRPAARDLHALLHLPPPRPRSSCACRSAQSHPDPQCRP